MLSSVCLVWSALIPWLVQDPLAQYRQAALERWESEIAALEKLDSQETDPEQAILFLGSSSIRRWDSIAHDMAPYRVIRRGYGGAKYSDLAVFVDRLVRPHRCEAVVIFVGNDITGNAADKTPEEVVRLLGIIVERIHAHRAGVPIFFVAVTPTSSRFAAWGKIQELNAHMRKFCEANSSLHYVDTVAHFLNQQGQPIEDYFVEDKLHLNASGYRVWSKLIQQALQPVVAASR